MKYTDSSFSHCGCNCGSWVDRSIAQEDNFGYRCYWSANTEFSCTANDSPTTNWCTWFGSKINTYKVRYYSNYNLLPFFCLFFLCSR